MVGAEETESEGEDDVVAHGDAENEHHDGGGEGVEGDATLAGVERGRDEAEGEPCGVGGGEADACKDGGAYVGGELAGKGSVDEADFKGG